jgi:AraC family transcriptional regulator of adaptative response/methylated-DNA-[protein]-cysteine methyltransferase
MDKSVNKSKNNYEAMRGLIEHIVKNKLNSQSLEELAVSFGVSSGHLQKMFTEWVGVTPKQFGRYMSLQYAKDLLAENKNTTEATVKSGLSSSGRLYDLFVDIEAMTPGEYQNQGKNLTIHYSVFDTQFGLCLVASTARGVCNVLFLDTEKQAVAELKSRWPKAKLVASPQKSRHKFHGEIENYLKGITPKSKIKLHLHGTNFQLKVWEALLSIPEGRISTYGDIAAKIGDKKSSRAVGAAVGDNPIGYLIPCHRVLKSTGEISGYHWGVDRKRAMLGYEAVRRNDGK